MPENLLHFDPVTIVILLAGFVGTWYTLRNDSKWHTAWIRNHDKECDEQRRTTNSILAKLTTLADTHDHRIERLENQQDRQRD